MSSPDPSPGGGEPHASPVHAITRALRMLDVDLFGCGESGSPEPGVVLGAYRLVEKLGEGGFGTVWRAWQEEPVRREVAVKILKANVASPESLRRFAVEREALANMDHPEVARLFDAGTTEAGHPYFVMELIRGEPVTVFCHARSLPVEQRLRIFLRICSGVQHAHEKGLLHRDLKPSNILVSGTADEPRVRVIDFGLARALAPRTDVSEHSVAGQLLGTLAYMSPEQAASGGREVDTRSDVYSLGAVLYELIAGVPPFVFDEQTTPLEEMLRTMREEDPPPPARRAMNSSGRSGSRAPVSDLDWITLRALSREPSRRYRSAASLADDVRRFLAHEPVEARPPAVGYRLRKFARRHTAALAAMVITAVSLITATAVSLVQARRARQAERETAAANAVVAEANERLKHENYLAAIRLAETRIRMPDMAHTVPGILWGTERRMRGWEWGWLMAQCQPQPQPLNTGGAGIFSLHVSADGSTVFAVAMDGVVSAWDARTRERRWRWPLKDAAPAVAPPPPGPLVQQSGLSPRGDLLGMIFAVALTEPWQKNPGHIVLLETATGRVRFDETRPEWGQGFAFDATGTGFYTGSSAGSPPDGPRRFVLGHWLLSNPAAPRVLDSIKSLPHRVQIAADPDGRCVAFCGNYTNSWTVLDAQSLQSIPISQAPNRNVTLAAGAVSSGPESFTVCAHADTVEYRTAFDAPPANHRLPSVIQKVSAIPGGSVFMSGSRWITRWKPGSAPPVVRHVDAELTTAAPTPDGGAVGGDSAGRLHFFPPIRPLRPASVPFGQDEPESRHAFLTPDGRTSVRIPWPRDVLRLSPASRHPESPPREIPLLTPAGSPALPAFDPDSGLLLIGTGFSPRTGKTAPPGLEWHDLSAGGALLRRRVDLLADAITAAISPHGSRVLVSWAGGSGLVDPGVNVSAALPAETAGALGFVWYPDGTRAIAFFRDKPAVVFTPDGSILGSLPHPCVRAAIHPDGQIAAFALSESAHVVVIDLLSGRELRRMETRGHFNGPWIACALFDFTPDGRRLITSDEGDAVHVWDWHLGRELVALRQPLRPSNGCISRDGRIIVATCYEPAMLLHFALPWDVEPGDPAFQQAWEENAGR